MTNRDYREQVEDLFSDKDASSEQPKPPDGWTGGKAIHTGGGVRTREWINEDRKLRVSYDLTEHTVYLEQIEWDEDIEEWTFARNIPIEDGNHTSDEAAIRAAYELMVAIEEDGLEAIN